MTTISVDEWLDVFDDWRAGRPIDPLVEELFSAIARWHNEGKSVEWIAGNLEASVFSLLMDVGAVEAIVAHIEEEL